MPAVRTIGCQFASIASTEQVRWVIDLAHPLFLQAAPAGICAMHSIYSVPTSLSGLRKISCDSYVAVQVLHLLSDMNICHCDLKPENILLQNLHSPAIKLIDFGSACYGHRTVHSYIQSRFYRSPEVLMGMPYGVAIDVWSMGTIVAELFLGLPLFPGESEYNQLARIITTRGLPPDSMIEAAPLGPRFFERASADDNTDSASTVPRRKWRLRTEAEYCMEFGGKPTRNKQYFKYSRLQDLFTHHPPPKPPTDETEATAEQQRRAAMRHFCEGLLQLTPSDRWTPRQAMRHPFITGELFTGEFIPPMRSPSAAHRAASNVSVNESVPVTAAPATSTSPVATGSVCNTSGTQAASVSSASSKSPAAGAVPASTEASTLLEAGPDVTGKAKQISISVNVDSPPVLPPVPPKAAAPDPAAGATASASADSTDSGSSQQGYSIAPSSSQAAQPVQIPVQIPHVHSTLPCASQSLTGTHDGSSPQHPVMLAQSPTGNCTNGFYGSSPSPTCVQAL